MHTKTSYLKRGASLTFSSVVFLEDFQIICEIHKSFLSVNRKFHQA